MLKPDVSLQKSNRKPSEENKPEESDARAGDTIQPIAVSG
jgi:hypothetical protein